MDILGQTALLLSVTSFALGFQVVARNLRNKLFLAYGILGTIVSLWALAFFLERVWPMGSFYRLHLLFNIWLAPAALTFIRYLVRINTDAVSRRLLDVSFLLSTGLTLALALGMEQAVPVILQLIYYAPVPIVFQILQLMWIDRRLRRGLKRLPKLPTVGFGRRNFIYAGGLLVMSTTVMDHVSFLPPLIPSFGNIALCVYFFFLSQAITQQRLLNFGALFSRFLVLLALALILTVIYSLLVAWIEDSPGLFFLNSFIVSFLILMVLDPLRTLVSYFTQRLLGQKQIRLQQTLAEAQRKLAGIVEPGALFQAVLLTTEQVLAPEWTALFILRSDGTKYRRVRATGAEPAHAGAGEGIAPPGSPLIKEILADHPLIEQCERLRKKGELPILLDQVLDSEIDRTTSRSQRAELEALVQALKALGSNLLIPLFDGEKVLGFVTLRIHAPPEPWGSNWGLLSVIQPYYEQAAQTLRSMEVYVRSREKERLATLGEMSAGLAHEIRNPLGAIKGAAQFLDPSQDRPDSRFLQIIIEETDRLNRVVSQFLDYSKPFAATLAEVDLAVLVGKTVEAMRAGLKQEIALEYEPPTHPILAQASAEQVQQVLVNLVQNAAKAIESRPIGPRGGRIRVELEAVGRGASREAAISVEDNGTGVRREHLDKLFIPFFTTSPSGTGLGLSISQKIVEAHKGRIEVSTEEGKFTRFQVILPALDPSKDAGAKQG